MSKYDPLRRYLNAQNERRVTMTFSQIGALVGGLPRSAFDYQAWWSNEVSPRTHVQKRAWMSASYFVERVDRTSQTVTFAKR